MSDLAALVNQKTPPEKAPTQSREDSSPASSPEINHLLAVLTRLYEVGISVACIDGRIRVADPGQRLTGEMRGELKAAIHAVWPDGRYD